MTTIAESFNKADSDTLGPDLTWVEDVGDIDIVSNKARCGTTAGAAFARAASSLAGDNQYAEITAYLSTGSAGSLGIGSAARKAASSTQTYYLLWMVYGGSSYNVTLYKVVATAFTALGTTNVNVTFANGDLLRIEANGTTIRGLIAGAEVISRTDSSIASGAQTGIRFYNNTGSSTQVDADSFAAGDLAGDPNGTAAITLLGDTIAASGNTTIGTSSSITLLGDVISAAGSSGIPTSAAFTLAGDTLSAAGSSTIPSSAAFTLAGDLITAAGDVGNTISCSAAITLLGDTLSASANLAIPTSAAIALSGDVIAAAGATFVLTTAAITLTGCTIAASGSSGTTTFTFPPCAIYLGGNIALGTNGQPIVLIFV